MKLKDKDRLTGRLRQMYEFDMYKLKQLKIKRIVIFGLTLILLGSSLYSQSNVAKQNVIWSHAVPSLSGVRFSLDGRYTFLNTQSWENGEFEVLETRTGKTVSKLSVCSFFVDFAISSDGKLLVVHCRKNGGNRTEIWDVPNGKLIQTISHKTYDEADLPILSPDGRRIITLDKSDKKDRPESAYYSSTVSSCYLWDAATANKIAVLSPPTVWRGANADGAKFSTDGKSVVTSYEGEISLWNADDGKLLQNLVDPRVPIKRHHAHDGIVRTFAFTSDRQKIVTGGFDGYVKIWDIATGTLERALPKQKGRIYKLFVSDDNRTLAAVNRDSVGDNAITIWKLATGELLQTIKYKHNVALPPQSQAMFIDNDSKIFLQVSDNKISAVVFDVKTGAEVWTSGDVVAVTPDGNNVLLSGGIDKTVALKELLK